MHLLVFHFIYPSYFNDSSIIKSEFAKLWTKMYEVEVKIFMEIVWLNRSFSNNFFVSSPIFRYPRRHYFKSILTSCHSLNPPKKKKRKTERKTNISTKLLELIRNSIMLAPRDIPDNPRRLHFRLFWDLLCRFTLKNKHDPKNKLWFIGCLKNNFVSQVLSHATFLLHIIYLPNMLHVGCRTFYLTKYGWCGERCDENMVFFSFLILHNKNGSVCRPQLAKTCSWKESFNLLQTASL